MSAAWGLHLKSNSPQSKPQKCNCFSADLAGGAALAAEELLEPFSRADLLQLLEAVQAANLTSQDFAVIQVPS